ncbi:MAG TPA: hypothetical protein VGH14_07325 [Solirubrobacterales bacterium]
MDTRKSIGALVLVVALGAMALAAPLASATRVTPAGTAIKATLAANSEGRVAALFIPTNAFATTSVQCLKSETTATTPSQAAGSENNTNRTGTGTFSTGPGGVFTDLSTPTFTECGVYIRSGSAWVKVKEAETKTNSTNGKWTLSVDALTPSALSAAIGVPSGGASIFIPTEATKECTITVSNERSSAVMGRWTNGTNSTAVPSTLKVDSQLSFAQAGAGCVASSSPAQFEATYAVRTNPEGATAVKVEE